MKNSLIIGKPNAGKTSFMISFAEYLGIEHYKISFKDINGHVEGRGYSFDLAQRYLVSSTPFKTKELQEIKLDIPKYWGKSRLSLIDSGGVIDENSALEVIRNSMLLTLQTLKEVSTILHIVDASAVNKDTISTISTIDEEINQYGRIKGRYCILANKMDLAESAEGLAILRKRFQDTYIIPVSTVNKIGFKEVRSFVARNI